MKARRLLRTEAIQICEERFCSEASELAKRYGVNVDTVYAVWNGTRWAELRHPNQGKSGKPRLSQDQNQHLKSMRGKISPEEAAQYFNISVKRVLAVWRES
jgi:transposase